MALKLIKVNTFSTRPFCVFRKKWWGEGPGLDGLVDLLYTTVCNGTPRIWKMSKTLPFVLVDYDRKVHLDAVCDACIKVIKANRPKPKPIVISGLDR